MRCPLGVLLSILTDIAYNDEFYIYEDHQFFNGNSIKYIQLR